MKAKDLRVGNYFTVSETRDDGVVIEINGHTIVFIDLNDKNTKLLNEDAEVTNVF